MKGLPIGYTQSGKKIRYEVIRGGKKQPGESSLLLMGPPRSGKNDVLVPMLMEYEGSAVVLTCKGDLCAVTAEHRRKRLKQDVVVLSPFEIPVLDPYIRHLPRCGINPLESLNPDWDAFGVECDAQAESVVIAKDNEREPHFIESAQGAVSGAIMGTVKYASPEKRNLVTVYEKVCNGGFFDFADDMVGRGDALLDGRLGRFVGQKDNKEMASIVSSAITQFRFMGNRAIMRALSPSGGLRMLHWEDLRNKRPTTVYVILPVEYLGACARFLRLALGSAIMRLLAHTSGLPVLLMIDEFAALGHMAIIENTMALSAGLNLLMLPVVQSADQLRGLYGERMQGFLSCAGCQIFLPPRDPVSAKLVSDLSGRKEVIAQSRSIGTDPRTGNPVVNDSASQQGVPVLSPDAVAGLGGEDMLIKVESLPDIIHAKHRRYWENPEYVGMLSPDPYHAGKNRAGGFWKSFFGS
jgi:type IV secretion system protein VirD4